MEVVPGLEYGILFVCGGGAVAGRLAGSGWRVGQMATFTRVVQAKLSPHLCCTRAHRRGVLTFPELIELFFVREFVALGVSLQHIRKTAEALSREVGEFPFSCKQVLVEGRKLLVREAKGLLKRPDIGQLVADFAEQFAQQIEFDGDLATRYYPPGYERQIYLDRRIRGGEPVVSERAIPTRVIYALWQREKRPALGRRLLRSARISGLCSGFVMKANGV
jgi:hypothetical protein